MPIAYDTLGCPSKATCSFLRAVTMCAARTSSKLKVAAQMHRLVVKISTLLARALGRNVLAFRRRCVNNAASAEPLVA